jgi:ADP-ribose pyrophosphatase YjhB (NUDIX family)
MSPEPSEYFASLPKRRVGAGALLLDGTGNVLMVEPVYKDHWEIPGGIVEEGEDPRSACERECLEELGLRLRIGRMLVVEHQTHEPPLGDSIMFVYDGGLVPDGAVLVLPRAELRSYRFVPSDRARLAGRQYRRAHERGASNLDRAHLPGTAHDDEQEFGRDLR